jgi:nucleoside-diphosphate-sugar epimerase
MDYIFSLAGQVSYVDSNADPCWIWISTARATSEVLEACRQARPRPG